MVMQTTEYACVLSTVLHKSLFIMVQYGANAFLATMEFFAAMPLGKIGSKKWSRFIIHKLNETRIFENHESNFPNYTKKKL